MILGDWTKIKSRYCVRDSIPDQFDDAYQFTKDALGYVQSNYQAVLFNRSIQHLLGIVWVGRWQI